MSDSLRARRERLLQKSAKATVLDAFGGQGSRPAPGGDLAAAGKPDEQTVDAGSQPAPPVEEETPLVVQEEVSVEAGPSGSPVFAVPDDRNGEDDGDDTDEEDERSKMSAEPSTEQSEKVFVQIGRVALILQKRYKNKLAVIVNVVDQRRAICDIYDPHKKEVFLVARALVAFKTIRLTKLVVEGIHWNSHSKFVTEKFKENKILEKFQATKFYKAWMNKKKRENMGDYERFKCAYIKKKRNAIIRKKIVELNKAGKA